MYKPQLYGIIAIPACSFNTRIVNSVVEPEVEPASIWIFVVQLGSNSFSIKYLSISPIVKHKFLEKIGQTPSVSHLTVNTKDLRLRECWTYNSTVVVYHKHASQHLKTGYHTHMGRVLSITPPHSSATLHTHHDRHPILKIQK